MPSPSHDSRLRIVVPSENGLRFAAGLLVLALAAAFVPFLVVVWIGILILAPLLFGLDYLLRPRRGSVVAARVLPTAALVGRESSFELRLENVSRRYLFVNIREVLPAQLEGDDLQATFDLKAGEERSFSLSFVGLRRGRFEFPALGLRLRSPLGLLEYQETVVPERS
ncbi:MAG: hypothetical protein AAF517_26155, partial [Planctomycetota bacterium]